MENIGIYRIQIGPHYYLGQSADLKKRKREHLWYLKNGTHQNKYMQRVYIKYQDFSFKVMIECDEDQLDYLEQSALDVHCGTEGCMNISKYAEAPHRGLKHSEETRKKMSESRKGVKHPMYGQHHSEETKRKMGEAQADKTLYRFIHDTHGEITCTRYELRKKYNLDRSNTTSLIKGRLKSHKGWRIN